MGKGRRQAEWVTLSQPTAKALRAWVARRGREPGPLFCFFRSVGSAKARRLVPGGRLAGDGMHALMAQWGDELGINLRPHGLRHSFVTTGLDATGGDLRAVRIAARHSSANVTIIYDDARRDLGGEVSNQVAARVASVIERMAGNSSDPSGESTPGS
jgi:integrase